ncbi:unnamed protein product [Peniophora sp. CBMAI 1063]|nr:unnamed protein product [Peniophora sp. CBMAI 1063]
MFASSVVYALSLGAVVFAAPSPVAEQALERRDTVTALSSSALAAFAPYTQFARAAYCDPSDVADWSCGDACKANSGFKPSITGGDGNALQYYYVGYWPAGKTVVVAHQGTDPTQLESDLTDINIAMATLDSTLFPGVPSGVQVHKGFSDVQKQTASLILKEVKSLMSANSVNSVTLVGHSLGGAIAELDTLMFKLNLPSATVKGVTYGTPRVGNPAFANFFDSKSIDFTRVDNRDDLVPIVPGRFLGFEHPSGQVHIISNGNAVACSGQENESDQCTDGAVPNIFDGNVIDHLGPYEGIYIGTLFCT